MKKPYLRLTKRPYSRNYSETLSIVYLTPEELLVDKKYFATYQDAEATYFELTEVQE